MNEISKDPFKDVMYVDNSNLQDDPSLLHDKKYLQRDNGVKILSANLKRKLPKFKMTDSNKQRMQRTHQNKQDEHKAPHNPIRTGGYFPPGWRFLAKNFGSNKRTQSKLGNFS